MSFDLLSFVLGGVGGVALSILGSFGNDVYRNRMLKIQWVRKLAGIEPEDILVDHAFVPEGYAADSLLWQHEESVYRELEAGCTYCLTPEGGRYKKVVRGDRMQYLLIRSDTTERE